MKGYCGFLIRTKMEVPNINKLYILLVSYIQSTSYANRDWVHTEFVYQTEDEARAALVKIATDTTKASFVDMMDLTIPVELSLDDGFFVLYHFTENYCKDYMMFVDQSSAKETFNRVCGEQDQLLEEDLIRVVTKTGGRLSSTLYEYDMFDKMNKLVYPDAGDRWVLVRLTMPPSPS